VLGDVAVATNFGTEIAKTGFVRTIAIRQYGGGLSGRPTECRYCQYVAPNGRCHGNHFVAFYIWGAHRRHLASTIEPSVCGGDAALCQIILTTCFILLRFTALTVGMIL